MVFSDLADEYISLVILKKLHYASETVHESWLKWKEPEAHIALREAQFEVNYGLTIFNPEVAIGRIPDIIYRCMQHPWTADVYDYIKEELNNNHHIQVCGFVNQKKGVNRGK
jgi:hypothetical protein